MSDDDTSDELRTRASLATTAVLLAVASLPLLAHVIDHTNDDCWSRDVFGDKEALMRIVTVIVAAGGAVISRLTRRRTRAA
jgi:hypothetical protein